MEYGRCRAMLEFARALEALGLPPSLLASSPCCRVVLGNPAHPAVMVWAIPDSEHQG